MAERFGRNGEREKKEKREDRIDGGRQKQW